MWKGKSASQTTNHLLRAALGQARGRCWRRNICDRISKSLREKQNNNRIVLVVPLHWDLLFPQTLEIQGGADHER